MLRKVISLLPMLVMALCLESGLAFASDACSPTNSNSQATTIRIPDVGTPNTPASGAADGWVLLYKDSEFKHLAHEVYCQGNKIRFATSVGKKNFQKNPSCSQVACTQAVGGKTISNIALKSDGGAVNNFIWRTNEASGFTVLYTFTDGGYATSDVIEDSSGNLYGTTADGGTFAAGAAYQLTPSNVLNVLYSFGNVNHGADGASPIAGFTRDSSGNLYGTAQEGGAGGWGAIYKLSPAPVGGCPSGSNTGSGWCEAPLYSFSFNGDGGTPISGLTLDSAGNLYGVTASGSPNNTMYKLSGTTLTVLPFPANSMPRDFQALALGKDGNLYGTTVYSADNKLGAVFQWNPVAGTYTVIYSFQGSNVGDGCYPEAAPVLDSAGNLYGTANGCGAGNNGAVWKLTSNGNGSYTESVLYSFTGGADGSSPQAPVSLDSAGNVYGVTTFGGNATGEAGNGVLFELTGTGETVLHTFNGATDGANPVGGVLISTADNNIYGTTTQGGPNSGNGTVWAYPLRFALTVTEAGTGTGTVTSSPSGINCGSVCSASFEVSTVVTLTEIPGSGSVFSGWSGGCSGTATTCQIAVDGATGVTATFTTSTGQSSTTTLNSTPNPSNLDQPVSFTATISGQSGTPTGSVTFYNGTASLGSGMLSSGMATLNTSALPAGNNSITAVYSGSATYKSSTSAVLTQVVNKLSTRTTLASSGPSTYGQNVTLTATVATADGGKSTGNVTFLNGSSPIGTGPVSGNVATLTINTLPAGTDSITATYSGDTNYKGSTSSALNQVVNKVTTTTALTSAPNSAVYGQNVTFTATITVANSDSVTGTVTFFNGAAKIGTGTVSNNMATLTIGTLAVGANSITATYGGDNNYSASTSPALGEVVGQAATSTSLGSLPNPSNYGQNVSITATIASQYGGVATGTVTLYNWGTQIGRTLTVNGNAATITINTLPAGRNYITATYSGDTNNSGSSSSMNQTVNNTTTTTTLTSSPSSPVASGTNVIFTATVTASSGGVPPAGSYMFFFDGNGKTYLGHGALTNGTATLQTKTLAIGTHAITAVYGGEADFAGSTSSVLTLVVK